MVNKNHDNDLNKKTTLIIVFSFFSYDIRVLINYKNTQKWIKLFDFVFYLGDFSRLHFQIDCFVGLFPCKKQSNSDWSLGTCRKLSHQPLWTRASSYGWNKGATNGSSSAVPPLRCNWCTLFSLSVCSFGSLSPLSCRSLLEEGSKQQLCYSLWVWGAYSKFLAQLFQVRLRTSDFDCLCEPVRLTLDCNRSR